MDNVFIFDIDGVVADNMHRLHFAKEKKWDIFYDDEQVAADGIISSGVNLVKCAEEKGYIVFATGRSDVCRMATVDWLKDAGIKYSELYMRRQGDHSKSEEAKIPIVRQIIEKYGVDKKYYFIDDSPKNAEAVEKAFPQVAVMVFGTKRFDQIKK